MAKPRQKPPDDLVDRGVSSIVALTARLEVAEEPVDQAAPCVNSGDRRSSNREARRAEADVDRALIDRAKQGDRGAFRELVERHQRRAHAVALALVRDENDAREVVQEAFLRVHKGLPTFQHGSSFFTWLYRIVSNLSIDAIRKPGRAVEDLEPPENFDDGGLPFSAHGLDPSDMVYRRQLDERIGVALAELPPYHRGVILMRELEGMSYEEMAEAMGVSKGTIMSRLFHARQKLQRALAGLYEDAAGHAPVPRSRKGSA